MALGVRAWHLTQLRLTPTLAYLFLEIPFLSCSSSDTHCDDGISQGEWPGVGVRAPAWCRGHLCRVIVQTWVS